jgi:hypothetical protein
VQTWSPASKQTCFFYKKICGHSLHGRAFAQDSTQTI